MNKYNTTDIAQMLKWHFPAFHIHLMLKEQFTAVNFSNTPQFKLLHTENVPLWLKKDLNFARFSKHALRRLGMCS